MNRTGARRKAGCAQERSVPRPTGRRAAVGETVPAHRGILFLGEPAGRAGALHVSANRVGGGFVREGIPAQAARRKAGLRAGALHVSANCVGGGFVRRGFPHRVASRLGQPCRRQVCSWEIFTQAARRKAGQRAGARHVSDNRVGDEFVRRGFPPRGAPVPPHSAFRIEARRPAIRDRPARPRDTP